MGKTEVKNPELKTDMVVGYSSADEAARSAPKRAQKVGVNISRAKVFIGAQKVGRHFVRANLSIFLSQPAIGLKHTWPAMQSVLKVLTSNGAIKARTAGDGTITYEVIKNTF